MKVEEIVASLGAEALSDEEATDLADHRGRAWWVSWNRALRDKRASK